MEPLFKHYIYKVTEADGSYLGLLKAVTSEFTLAIDINSLGPASITISVAQTGDTAQMPVKAITTEDGKIITTEDGKWITTEGDPPNFGIAHSKIQNGNIIQIIEVSNYHPEGLLVFTGQIQNWEVDYGNDDDMTIEVIPQSTDMNNTLITGPAIVPYSQLTENGTVLINGTNYITAAMNFSPSYLGAQSIKLRLRAVSGPADVTVTAYSFAEFGPQNSIGTAGVAQSTQTITLTSAQDYVFGFPTIVAAAPASGGLVGVSFNIQANGDILVDRISPAVNPTTAGYLYNGLFASLGNELYAELSYPSDETLSQYINTDPGDMVADAVDDYRIQGGKVQYDSSTVIPTGTLIPEYTFSLNTTYEVLKTALAYAPPNYYYTIDPGTNVLTFRGINTAADHIVILKKHIQNLKFGGSIKNLKNRIFYTGGKVGSNNLYLQVDNEASQQSFGRQLDRITDVKVTDSDTGETAANAYLNKNDDEQFVTTLVIVDGVVDITTYKVGQTVRIMGTGNPLIDSIVLPIVRIMRRYDTVLLSLGSLPMRESTIINDTKDKVLAVQTIDNPNQPS